ncbi:flagellar hook-associated protein FlgK [Geodermatophilus sabuli]|uniref:Flagellar hook-associated protein 1 n=1 Tax=Geodermatophilus sabuli TaxID=1564158 RepID=A0A7K3VZ16_9ACTN|nr:flagellar hook-associated protein FlgK [Geodermatophilus sabuli]
MSTFGSLNTATTALWAQRRGLDVTGQNIANVNTEGYSRQRAELRAMGGTGVAAFYSVSPATSGGVKVEDVIRIRDSFLEGRGHLELGNHARLTAETEALGLVEQAFREPGDTGIQSLLSDMWSGWGDVANAPKDEAARSQVLQRTSTLVAGINTADAALVAQWGQNRDNIEVLVSDVNSSSRSIAELNHAIARASLTGMPVNELTDRRDVLVMKLAGQVGATARPGADGAVDVVVGGISLVSGSTATALEVQGTLAADDLRNPGFADRPRIVTTPGGVTIPAGGQAGGQLTALNSVVPEYRARLDQLAQDLASALNTAHRKGFDRNGDPGTDLLGAKGGATTITAANLRLEITDPLKVAASSVGPTAGVPALDSGNADALSELRLRPSGPDADYRRMIVDLGVQGAVSKRNLDIQSVVLTQVDAARESVSGVNLDEEMSNMLQFQHAYSAAARMVTAIDEALDVLINRTGVVGR